MPTNSSSFYDNRTDFFLDHFATGLVNRLIPGNKKNITLLVIYDVFGGFHFILLGFGQIVD
jgi:hypothetical protein